MKRRIGPRFHCPYASCSEVMSAVVAVVDLSSVGEPSFALPYMPFSQDRVEYISPPVVDYEQCHAYDYPYHEPA